MNDFLSTADGNIKKNADINAVLMLVHMLCVTHFQKDPARFNLLINSLKAGFAEPKPRPEVPPEVEAQYVHAVIDRLEQVQRYVLKDIQNMRSTPNPSA